MSALAVLLKNKGHAVQGSNLEPSEETEMLLSRGIKVFFGHDAKNVQNANVVVYNSAIKEGNPELAHAREKNLVVLTRAQMLASIASEYSTCIAISGSHGKTTTTSMIGHILQQSGKKPTVHVGGIMINYGSNFLDGDKSIFVTEACEYKNNFHALSPTTLVVLNIESDHLDFFKNYAAIQKSFQTMADKSQSLVIYSPTNLQVPSKTVFFCTDSNTCNQAELGNQAKATVWAKNLRFDKQGKYTYDCYLNAQKLGEVALGVPCEHNVSNSLAAIATCLSYDVDFKTIQKALKSFIGVRRRFELMGTIGKAIAVHDYAHHPTEIASTISSARKFCTGKIWVVFEPHTYSRTKSLMSEFLTALMQADELIVVPTYAAREEYQSGGDASDLCRELSKLHYPVLYAKTWQQAHQTLHNLAGCNDIILLLGAGTIVHFYEHYVALQAEQIV